MGAEGIGSKIRGRLRLAVDKVVHHHDVAFPPIVRPGCRVAGDNADSGDDRLVEHEAKKGKVASPGEAGTIPRNSSLLFASK